MAKLFKLPNGSFVDPSRVSSIEAKEREFDEPCLVVTTLDGVVVVIDQSTLGKSAGEARNEIAEKINENR